MNKQPKIYNQDSKTIRVLLIEDDPENALLLCKMLTEAAGFLFNIEHVDRLQAGLDHLAEAIDVVLLDLNLPDSYGVDTLNRIHTQAPEKPIVVLTGLDDEMLGIKALQEGAQDYLVKGSVDSGSVVRCIRNAIERQANQDRFHFIIKHNADAIILVDKKGIVRFVNPAAESIFNVDANKFLGELFGFPIVIGKEVEIDVLRKDGQITIAEMRVTDLEWKGENVYLVSLRDITDRKEIDRMKSEFISTVSHELRTPLTSIVNALTLVAGGETGKLPEQAEKMVHIAYRNSQRLMHLINNMLDSERIESGRMELHLQPLELMLLVKQAIEANYAYAEQLKVKFVLIDTLSGVKVNADSTCLMQVLTNLLTNAAKFSSPNDSVTISISRHNEAIRVAVTDHGPGISKEFRNRIFQRFAKIQPSGANRKGGSGLGLSIAKEIVERMSGQIGFETKVNVGTTFYFDLPEYRDPVS